MEELSMKETLKAGDERKVEEDFFQYIVIRLGDEQYGIGSPCPMPRRFLLGVLRCSPMKRRL